MPAAESKSPERILGLGLVGLIGLVWVASFGLHLGDLFAGRTASVPIYVETVLMPPGTIVRGFWSGAAERDGLRVGDKITRVGNRPGPLESLFHFLADARHESRNGSVTVEVERRGPGKPLKVSLEPRPWPGRSALASAAVGFVGLAILLLAAPSRAALLMAAASFLHASHIANFTGPSGTTARVGVLAMSLGIALSGPLFANAIQCLAGNPVSRVERVLPWILLLQGLVVFAAITGTPYGSPYSMPLFLVFQPLTLGVLLVVLVRGYRRAEPGPQRQLRWIILGLALTTVPIAAASVLATLVPETMPFYSASLSAAVAIPICVAIAILRARLFDVDRAVGGASAYAVVAVVIALIVEFLGEPLASRAASFVGLPESLGQGALVAALALSAQPAQRRLKPLLNQLLLGE